jgi:hypothetical protein
MLDPLTVAEIQAVRLKLLAFADRRASRLFNRIRQDLTKDRIVSFEHFRKSRVNG